MQSYIILRYNQIGREKIIKKLITIMLNIKYLDYLMYGPGQDLKNMYQVWFLSILHKHYKKSVGVKGSLNRKRDCIYIDDVIKILKSNKCKYNNIYNVGTGSSISVKKYFIKFQKH